MGKSSAGCRLLGFKPFGNSARPFEVAATSNAVTTKIQKQDGFWLGDPHFPLRVIDTPGMLNVWCPAPIQSPVTATPLHITSLRPCKLLLDTEHACEMHEWTSAHPLHAFTTGSDAYFSDLVYLPKNSICVATGLNDPQGPHVDTLNMAKIGRYLDQEPVNCVLFVLSDGNPRIDHVMKRLINIVIQKVDKQDYDKLGFIVNRYKNDDAAKSERQELADGQSEADIKNRKRGEIKASLQGTASAELDFHDCNVYQH